MHSIQHPSRLHEGVYSFAEYKYGSLPPGR